MAAARTTATGAGGSGGIISTTSSAPSPSIPFFGNANLLPTSRALAVSTFLACDESIVIIPSFSLSEPLTLISAGIVGPFRAGMNIAVPLWLGLMLRRRKLARLLLPPWMDSDNLRNVLRYERDVREATFSPDLPWRHAELARAILGACGLGAAGSAGGGSGGDDNGHGGGGGGGAEIPNAHAIKLLLEDIASVRMDKIRRNVHQLSSTTLKARSGTEIVIDVTNIGSLEMHAIKPFVLESFRLHRELSGRGTSYSKDVVELDNSNGGGGGVRASSSGGGVQLGGVASATSNNHNRGGRLQQSRLAKERENAALVMGVGEEEEEKYYAEEELEVPRPIEDIEGGGGGGDTDGDERGLRMGVDHEEDEMVPPPPTNSNDASGRSRLRRHR